jgi:hypothetical protein
MYYDRFSLQTERLGAGVYAADGCACICVLDFGLAVALPYLLVSRHVKPKWGTGSAQGEVPVRMREKHSTGDVMSSPFPLSVYA